MRTGKYLNENERYLIEVELSEGTPIAKIARKLGRGRCTIQREIARGSCEQLDWSTGEIITVYKADYATMRARQRAENKGAGLKIGRDLHTATVLEGLIKNNHWSPAAALGFATRHGLIDTVVSVPTLYAYIKAGVLSVTEADLPRKGAQKRHAARMYRHAHRNIRGTSIEERPKAVKNRREFGHWEGDLIVGKHGTKTVYLTLLERKSRYVIAMRLENKKMDGVVRCVDVLEKKYGRSFSEVFKSITFDNGSEFSDFEGIERSRYKTRRETGVRTKVYYAHPYCSSERGSNENCNGLLRRAGFMKGSNLGLISKSSEREFVDWVNNLPRKILGFQTASEVFAREMGAIRRPSLA